MVYRLLLVLPLLLLKNAAAAQNLPHQNEDTSRIADAVLISRYIKEIDSKAEHTDEKLDKYTSKTLQRWKQQEEKIKRRLAKKDSVKAVALFGNADEQYKQLQTRLDKSASLQHYIPTIDTATTSLKFLLHNPNLFAAAEEKQQKLKEALAKVKAMEGQFQKAEEIKKFLRDRKSFLKNELSKFGFAKELKKLSKQGYYYQQQIEENKSLLKDHKKAEKKVIELLSKTKFFQNFFRKNSMLASLFRLPGDPDDPISTASLAGLQTRASVNNLIQQQIAAGGTNSQQQFSQNLQAAQSQLNEIKNKFNQLGSGSSDMEMPEGFKENSQRRKNFWKKWEVGINMQSNRANGIIPVSSDVGISAGFKPNNWFIAGGGFAGRIGWGKNIRHIAISYSGISIRSFAEVKFKSGSSFHAVAGYEMNYRPEIRNIEQLKDKNGWQNSGIVGLSKVVSVKTKFFKKTKLMLAWDFLSYHQIPATQPVIFRVSYNIK